MAERQRMTREQRREQVERCLAAGMTVKEWCELNHVSKSTMYYWMERLRKEEPDLFGDPTCGEWIEMSRGSIAARTALTVRAGDDDRSAEGPHGPHQSAQMPPARWSSGSTARTRLCPRARRSRTSRWC